MKLPAPIIVIVSDIVNALFAIQYSLADYYRKIGRIYEFPISHRLFLGARSSP